MGLLRARSSDAGISAFNSSGPPFGLSMISLPTRLTLTRSSSLTDGLLVGTPPVASPSIGLGLTRMVCTVVCDGSAISHVPC